MPTPSTPTVAPGTPSTTSTRSTATAATAATTAPSAGAPHEEEPARTWTAPALILDASAPLLASCATTNALIARLARLATLPLPLAAIAAAPWQEAQLGAAGAAERLRCGGSDGGAVGLGIGAGAVGGEVGIAVHVRPLAPSPAGGAQRDAHRHGFWHHGQNHHHHSLHLPFHLHLHHHDHGHEADEGRGELAPSHVRRSATTSLATLKAPKARWVLATRPDAEVPLALLAGGLSGLVHDGVCEAVSSDRFFSCSHVRWCRHDACEIGREWTSCP
jgi:hypothetical protein